MRIRPLGVLRGIVVIGALAAFPFLETANWLVTIGIWTLMYAALATAWNLFAGYSGYISLGHVAFFGIGAYTVANTFSISSPLRGSAYSFNSHAFMSIGNGYRPFYVLPLVGIASFGLLLSTVTRNSAASVVGTLMWALLMQLLGVLPGTEPIRPYLLGTQFEAWHGFLRVPADWTPVIRALWVCALYIALPIVAAYLVFLRRDVAAE